MYKQRLSYRHVSFAQHNGYIVWRTTQKCDKKLITRDNASDITQAHLTPNPWQFLCRDFFNDNVCGIGSKWYLIFTETVVHPLLHCSLSKQCVQFLNGDNNCTRLLSFLYRCVLICGTYHVGGVIEEWRCLRRQGAVQIFHPISVCVLRAPAPFDTNWFPFYAMLLLDRAVIIVSTVIPKKW